ncbi:unnamed protein product [Linum trigynum]|uniref:Glutaredoxin domain-containing protein n=1 Tax=Linum trigynum TaxID=586398 RepID=A0AAV2C731_9ROSI
MGCSISRFTILSSLHTHHSLLVDQPPSIHAFHPGPATGRRAVSHPAPLVHHPPSGKGDSEHLVYLTSTTYGSVLHIPPPPPPPPPPYRSVEEESGEPVASPDSVINAWELMDGLDDGNGNVGVDFNLGKPLPPTRNSCWVEELGLPDQPEKKLGSPSKPLWKHFSEESFLLKLDPVVVSSYRRALFGKSNPKKSVHSDSESGCSPQPASAADGGGGKGEGGGEIVVFFTSLRGIRKTYEDCCTVRTIFRGLRVAVDERDVSMHSAYGKELRGLLAVGNKMAAGGGGSLPQVFIGGKHVGGAEEIRRLNESGELSELVKGFPARDCRWGCGVCGDARFVLCSNCNGSRKVFDEDEERLRRCLDCNENGLIRCRSCSV